MTASASQSRADGAQSESIGLATGSNVGSLAEERSSQRTGAVSMTLAILRLLAAARLPMGVNAIARELSLPPSSCFRILKQLQAEDFADFDSELKLYSLGNGAIAIAQGALDPAKAFTFLRRRMEKISTAHGVTVGLWRRISDSRISLTGFVECNSPMRIQMSLGQRLPMLMGAVGRAIAAELDMPEGDLKREFDPLRWQVPISFEDYCAQLQDARIRGYAIDRNNFAKGVTTVSVAIRDSHGTVSHGLSGIMFSDDDDHAKVEAVGNSLLEVKRWASSRVLTT